MQAILARWSDRDWRPVVVTFDRPDPAVADNPGVKILPIKADRLWRARLAAAYQGPYDGVFYPGAHHFADWFGLCIRRVTGRAVPIVSTIEGLLGEVGSDARERRLSDIAGHPVFCQRVPSGVLRRMEAIYRRSDHIIAISPFLAKMAEALYGPKVSSLPLGVDTALFRPQGGLQARPRVVGAGGVFSHKRPELFLTMAARFPQADFVWFGEGALRQALCARVAQDGLSNLSFPGALPPPLLASEFGKSSIFVLPSLAEGVPKVTQEAAAAGLAQVVFGFYEAPSVTDGLNGFVVWNDQQLLERLGQLIDNGTLVHDMGRAGEAMARDWAWATVAPLWEERIVRTLNVNRMS